MPRYDGHAHVDRAHSLIEMEAEFEIKYFPLFLDFSYLKNSIAQLRSYRIIFPYLVIHIYGLFQDMYLYMALKSSPRLVKCLFSPLPSPPTLNI